MWLPVPARLWMATWSKNTSNLTVHGWFTSKRTELMCTQLPQNSLSLSYNSSTAADSSTLHLVAWKPLEMIPVYLPFQCLDPLKGIWTFPALRCSPIPACSVMEFPVRKLAFLDFYWIVKTVLRGLKPSVIEVCPTSHWLHPCLLFSFLTRVVEFQ